MATKRRATTYQYEPLITPSAWHGDERQFSIRLTQIVDDLYQKYSALRQKLKETSAPSAPEPDVPEIDFPSISDIYPVGSIYMSVNSVDPGTLFGGTWERIRGRFLLAASTPDGYEAGKTGGEATHTLTVDEIPSHAHDTTKTPTWPTEIQYDGEWGILYDASDKTFPHTDWMWRTSEAGGSKPHNNMPPYLAVYMWKRVA